MATSAQPASFADRIRTALAIHETRLIAMVSILLVWRLWISPLPSSFWIDETGTVWAIRGTFHDVLARLDNYLFPQMPLFAFFMWGWSRIAGLSETALRIPSVAASIGSIFAIYALGKTLLNRSAALYAVVILITLSHVDYAAADARAYAPAIVCLIATLYFRVRWAQTGRLLHAILYGIGCGLCVNLIYFFAAGLAADLLYLAIAWRLGWVRWRNSVILSWLIAFALFLPLVPTLRILTQQSGIHTVAAGMPSWTDFGVSLVPPRWILAAIFGTAAALLLARGNLVARFKGERSTLLMISLWAFAPQLLIFAYSFISHHSIFLPRYLLASAPGSALLGGYLIASLETVVWRLSIVAVLAAISMVTQGFHFWTDHYIEDWRGASAVIAHIRAAQPGIPLIAASSYVESKFLPMPAGPGADYGFMLSPFAAYPIPGDAVLLPVEMTPENHPYVVSVVEAGSRAGHFLMLFPSGSPLLPWIRGRLDAQFQLQELHSNPVVLDVTRK